MKYFFFHPQSVTPHYNTALSLPANKFSIHSTGKEQKKEKLKKWAPEPGHTS